MEWWLALKRRARTPRMAMAKMERTMLEAGLLAWLQGRWDVSGCEGEDEKGVV